MKITGAEFIDWYENHWPFRSPEWNDGDWYHENGEIPSHNDDGDWNLDPAATYNAYKLGRLHYQGNGVDPTDREGYSVASLIQAWRRTHDVTVLAIEVPKAREAELRELLDGLGIKICA